MREERSGVCFQNIVTSAHCLVDVVQRMLLAFTNKMSNSPVSLGNIARKMKAWSGMVIEQIRVEMRGIKK